MLVPKCLTARVVVGLKENKLLRLGVLALLYRLLSIHLELAATVSLQTM